MMLPAPKINIKAQNIRERIVCHEDCFHFDSIISIEAVLLVAFGCTSVLLLLVFLFYHSNPRYN